MGGSEGMAGEDPGYGVPSGVVHDITMPKLGETVTEGTIGQLAQAGRRHGRVRRPPLRGEHRQGRLGDPQPVRRRAAGGAGRRRARPHRSAPCWPASVSPARCPAEAPRAERRPDVGARGPGGLVGTRLLAAATPPADRNGRMLSPLVRRLVAEAGLDVDAITGSGAGGRIRREDVERAIAAARSGRPRPRGPRPACPAAAAARTARAAPAAAGRRPAAPRPAALVRLRRRTRATRSSQLLPHASGRRGRDEGLAGRSRRRCGPPSRSTSTTSSGCASSSRTGSRPRPGRRCPTCRSSRGPSSTPCARTPPSTPRSTSRPRR